MMELWFKWELIKSFAPLAIGVIIVVAFVIWFLIAWAIEAHQKRKEEKKAKKKDGEDN